MFCNIKRNKKGEVVKVVLDRKSVPVQDIYLNTKDTASNVYKDDKNFQDVIEKTRYSYWGNRSRRGDRWNNSGYTEREDGTKVSNRALSAEQSGKFTQGTFKKKYGITANTFNTMVLLGLVETNEWHHTGKSFKESDFYEWKDVDLVEYNEYGEVGESDGKSLLEMYLKNKKKIDTLAKQFINNEWLNKYVRIDIREIPTKEEYARSQVLKGDVEDLLSEDYKKEVQQKHEAVSEGRGTIPSFQRYEMHKEIDIEAHKEALKILEIKIEELLKQDGFINDYENAISEDKLHNKEVESFNKTVREENAKVSGKEKILAEVMELMGQEEVSELIEKISSRERYKEDEKRRLEEKRVNEQKLQEERAKARKEFDKWVEKYKRQGKIVEVERVQENPDNFIVTYEEMNGKYGWFEASSRYNLPVYYSGLQFASKRLYNSFLNRKSEIYNIGLGYREMYGKDLIEETVDKGVYDELINTLKKRFPNVEVTEDYGDLINNQQTDEELSLPELINGVEKYWNGEEVEGNEKIRHFIGKKARFNYENQIKKKNTKITDEKLKESLDYLHLLEDNKENTKLIKTAVHWLKEGTIILPEDMPKVEQAVEVAKKHKLDPMQFDKPMDIINEYHSEVEYGEEVDPDKLEGLSGKKEILLEGSNSKLVIYNVENNDVGQEAVCKIVHQHFGWDTELGVSKQPWCLASFTRQGKPTDSAKSHWFNTYNTIDKKIAFLNGKPIAFRASDNASNAWWDNQDVSREGISIPDKIPNDKLGRKGFHIFNLEKGSFNEEWENIYRGNKKNGIYEEWYDKDTIKVKETYKNGNKVGLCKRWFKNGNLQFKEFYKNNSEVNYEAYGENGIIQLRTTYKNGAYNGLFELWYEDGKPWYNVNYKNGNKEGVYKIWDREGNVSLEQYFYNDEVVTKEDYKRLLELEKENNKNTEVHHSKELHTSDGVIYGAVKGNKVYLNPNTINFNTPIHEFGHLWVTELQNNHKELWLKGKELIKDSVYYQEVLNDENYQGLTEDEVADEAIARALGDNGAKIVKEKGLGQALLDWISDVWRRIGSAFGIENLTSEQIQNLSLQDFIEIGNSDLLVGKEGSNISQIFKETQRNSIIGEKGAKKIKELKYLTNEQIEDYARKIENGEVKFDNFTKEEFEEGYKTVFRGNAQKIFSLHLGANERLNDKHSTKKRQLISIARGLGIAENYSDFIGKMGKSHKKGAEADVWVDVENKKVIKMVHPLDLARDGERMSDDMVVERYSLFNYLFPETGYTFEGIITNKEGTNFEYKFSQPFVFIDTENKLTTLEIDHYIENELGAFRVDSFEKDFASDEYLIPDLHNENIVRGLDGKIYVIDSSPILNTEEDGYGGVRERKNTLSSLNNSDKVIENNEKELQNKQIEDLWIKGDLEINCQI